MVIIMGDLNARVGKNQQKRQQHVDKKQYRTIHSGRTENENGTRLTDFGEINNIIISNTFSKHQVNASNIVDASGE